MKKIYLILLMLGLIGQVSPAGAADTCSNIGCADLGYSKTDVENCTAYIYCPLDSSYKICIKQKSYVSSCPSGGVCDTKYEVIGCKPGYKLGEDKTCNPVEECLLSSCPTGANCKTVSLNGATQQLISSCSFGYVEVLSQYCITSCKYRIIKF